MNREPIRQRLTDWSSLHPYAASLALVAIVTAIGLATAPVLHVANIDIVYLLVVLVSALRWGRDPAIFTAMVSVVVFDFCYIPPQFSFAITDLPYLTTLVGFIAVAIATSTLAARARELTREQSARAQAEARSQAKDEVLNRISHELRAPVNAVLGWAQLLAQSDLERDRIARGVLGLQHSTQLLARLADDLLNASRITSGKLVVLPEPTPLAEAVSRAIDVVAAAAEAKGITLETSIAEVGMVMADPHRVEQILANLVLNAVKFTPEGGRVTVRLARAGDHIELTVSDTGIGIPADFMPRIFDAFTQADMQHAHSGLGLGLAIVKALVEAHDGTIAVHSAGKGHGATFTVRFPTLSGAHHPGHDGKPPRSTAAQPA